MIFFKGNPITGEPKPICPLGGNAIPLTLTHIKTKLRFELIITLIALKQHRWSEHRPDITKTTTGKPIQSPNITQKVRLR